MLEDYSQVVEKQIPLAIDREFKRLEAELDESEDYERHMHEQWMYEYTEEVLPRLFRSPILIALWAVFESGVHEIAESLQQEGGHALGPDDLRGKNDFDKYQKYYEHILGMPLVGVEGKQEHLDTLQLVRHALAHSNGRIEIIQMTRPKTLKRIQLWERAHGGISIDRDYLTVTAEFVQTMIQTVRVVMEDLIRRAKENT